MSAPFSSMWVAHEWRSRWQLPGAADVRGLDGAADPVAEVLGAEPLAVAASGTTRVRSAASPAAAGSSPGTARASTAARSPTGTTRSFPPLPLRTVEHAALAVEVVHVEPDAVRRGGCRSRRTSPGWRGRECRADRSRRARSRRRGLRQGQRFGKILVRLARQLQIGGGIGGKPVAPCTARRRTFCTAPRRPRCVVTPSGLPFSLR